MAKPLAIDLFCGLGGWTEGFLAEGYDVVGFDIERHVYGDQKYPAQLVLQDVLTLDGRQFRNAAVIVASPPCQAYSYRAMPWKRAKALGPPDNSLFEACFRIAREAGVPLVVENVKGAQKWVGRATWHYGSFYLWGDVPALMPATRSFKMGRAPKSANGVTRRLTNPLEWRDEDTREFGTKNDGGSWFNQAHNTHSGRNRNPVHDGTKVSGDWFGTYAEQKAAGTISPGRLHGKNSAKRKAASAQIAKIPFPLAQHIAKVFKPQTSSLTAISGVR